MFEMLPTERAGFHVSFELRPEEDRETTLKQGHPAWKDVEFAVITMPGGGLVVDKKINDKLLEEWRSGDNMRKPPAPFALHAYEAWKNGLDAPVNGTDLKNWPGVTPAQLRACQTISVYAVEDLAEANADIIRKLGMGGVALVEKAKAFLSSADVNKASEQIAALMVRMEGLEEALQSKSERIAELESELDPAPKKRGRPPKE